MQQKHCVIIAILVAGFLTNTGCGGKRVSLGDDKETRVVMNVLSIFYGEYLESHRGKPPQNSGDFRNYLESRSEDLTFYHVANPDQLLTSPRDGQPFVIVCGKRHAPKDSPGTPWAAYEQSGIEGKRMAVRVRGGAYELSADEIAQIFPNN